MQQPLQACTVYATATHKAIAAQIAAWLGQFPAKLVIGEKVASRIASTVSAVVSVSTALFVTGHLLGRLGLLRGPLARVYFVATAPPFILVGRIGAELLNGLGYVTGLSLRQRQSLCTWVFSSSYAWWIRANGHIKVSIDPESVALWKTVDVSQSCATLVNHTSFLDALIVPYCAPHYYRAGTRVLFMAKMASWPIIGPCYRLGGHFPVHFAKYVEGHFRVSEKQAAVNVRFDQYLREGGHVLLFPEASINKTPMELKPFRHGTFKSLVGVRAKRVFILTMAWPNQCWPANAAIGGYPAHIRMRFREMPTDYENETAEQMAVRAHSFMQQQLLDMLESK
jgi:hypothetical protein